MHRIVAHGVGFQGASEWTVVREFERHHLKWFAGHSDCCIESVLKTAKEEPGEIGQEIIPVL